MKKILPVILLLLVFASPALAADKKAPALPKVGGAMPQGLKGPIGQRFVLDNGMVLLVKENHALPVVMVNMIIKAGAVMEPPDKAGLAHITAALLTKGAAGMSATDISEAIDFIGGSLSVGGGTDFASASLSVLKKDVDTGFPLLAKVLVSPDFKPEEIDRMKTAIKAGILRDRQDPEAVAGKAYAKAVFGPENPYGRPAEGTVESVDKITRDDIVGFHNTFYAPNNCIIAVVGDITADEAKALIAKYMGGWKKKDIPKPILPPTPTAKGVEHINIDRNITQADILMGHLGVTRENPDYYTLYVMNYILGGGGFVSRILDKIRDDMGLAYSAYSYFDAEKFNGSWTAGMQTKNKTVKEAIDETVKIIKNIQKAPVTDKELRDAKDYITGSFPLKTDTNSKIAQLLAQVEFYHLDINYFEMYEREINKVTKEGILKAARKYLHPDNMYIVVVGDLKEAGIK